MAGPKNKSVQVVQVATTDAVSWTIKALDDFDVPRIELKWASGVTTSEDITLTKDAAAGAAYDAVFYTLTVPAGATSVSITGCEDFVSGDAVVLAFTNTDGISITGTATVKF